jgi:hypothetical protein
VIVNRAVLLALSRYLAAVFAVGLAVAETLINSSRPEWQYAPLWIIDFVISLALLCGFWVTRRGAYIPVLMAAFALSAGVFYIAFFGSIDPELPESARGEEGIVALIGLGLAASVAGLAGSAGAWIPGERAAAAGRAHPREES